MSSFTNTFVDNREKYPAKIQKLFSNNLPAPFFKPVDYPPTQRKTKDITPIREYKNRVKEYVDNLPELDKKLVKPPKTKLQVDRENYRKKRNEKLRSFIRQTKEWEHPDSQKLKDWKDPYRTVFISRLDYALTEVDITKHFNTYGSIESIKIIRDKQNKSRGYGFIVFEKDTDASNCVKQLASTGLKVSVLNADGTQKSPVRTILVDMERSRVMNNWKPRRLGGGLGGRGYTTSGVNSSAASSGRRLNLSTSTTPYDNNQSHNGKSYYNQYPRNSNPKSEGSYGYGTEPINPTQKAFTSHPGFKDVTRTEERNSRANRNERDRTSDKPRDKYSKYDY